MTSIQIFALFILPGCIAAFGLIVGVRANLAAHHRRPHPGE
jgi:hypothetical protein